ncbi:hypothetical protein MMC20_005747 [Loxospora ochrophaea]|nr:hypothetical protein [Loxospora ochrophaea]
MSVTASVPPLSSSSGFSSIFSSRQSSKPKPADVIYTLSSAVKSLENETGPRRNQLQSNSSQTIPQEVDMQAIITEASTSNAGNATPKNGNTNQFQSVHLDMANLAQTFRPYNVPPPPIPMDSGNDSSQQIGSPQSAGEGEAIVKQKSFSTVVTILENTHQDGSKSYSAESSPIRENTPDELIPLDVIPREKSPKARLPGSQPFLQRMLERQEKWDDFREETKRITWGAISVRRQRKLKMKKHKYKKLMRRTRNLRRRQDRL